MMRINERMISIPPYISTTWNNVAALHMKGNLLIISLNDGENVTVPGLKQELIDHLFNIHSTFVEKNSDMSQRIDSEMPKLTSTFSLQSSPEMISEMPFKLGFSNLENGIGTAMQHNPAQSTMPDLPPEMLSKVSAIAKIIAPEEVISTLKAEPHCNCVHCQIVRAINHGHEKQKEHQEDIVYDEELHFQQWDITQTGDKLFTVCNRLDALEKYNVYLGSPVGCTCGREGCEHILAVLKS